MRCARWAGRLPTPWWYARRGERGDHAGVLLVRATLGSASRGRRKQTLLLPAAVPLGLLANSLLGWAWADSVAVVIAAFAVGLRRGEVARPLALVGQGAGATAADVAWIAWKA